ncbi:MAG: hypothetical protein EAZ91_03755 [Cytophagales bacterium]|nr:MAG: hypothetical protein EAZ91_03755 [Cytophagales bacterium]
MTDEQRLIQLQGFAKIDGTSVVFLDEDGKAIGDGPLHFSENALSNDVVFTTNIQGQTVHFINTIVALSEEGYARYRTELEGASQSDGHSSRTQTAYRILSAESGGKNPINKPPGYKGEE